MTRGSRKTVKPEGDFASPLAQTATGLVFLAMGLAALTMAIFELTALTTALWERTPGITTSNWTFVWPTIGIACAVLGAGIVLGAWRPALAMRYVTPIFAVILVLIVLSVVLMAGGSTFTTALLEWHGYALCAERTGWRMWAGDWMRADIGCPATSAASPT